MCEGTFVRCAAPLAKRVSGTRETVEAPLSPPKTTHVPVGPPHSATASHGLRAPRLIVSQPLSCPSTSSPSVAYSALADAAEQSSGPASRRGADSRGASRPPSQCAATVMTDEENVVRAAPHLPHGDGTPDSQAGVVLRNTVHPTGPRKGDKTGKVRLCFSNFGASHVTWLCFALPPLPCDAVRCVGTRRRR